MTQFKIGDRIKLVAGVLDEFKNETGTITHLYPNEKVCFIKLDEKVIHEENIVDFVSASFNNLQLISAEKEIDLSMYPHKCTRCGKAAYIGFTNKVDCSNPDCK